MNICGNISLFDLVVWALFRTTFVFAHLCFIITFILYLVLTAFITLFIKSFDEDFFISSSKRLISSMKIIDLVISIIVIPHSYMVY